MSKTKKLLIIAVLMMVIVFNGLDIFHDLRTDASYYHLIQESIMIVFSLGLIFVLLINLKQQKNDLAQLKQELASTEQNLAITDQRATLARQNYSEFIKTQFKQWQLSQSEQEIALLLLKGLSFNEISALRETKEKTVRQQASEIYKKSGVSGRHAFSAWFFEDFLN